MAGSSNASVTARVEGVKNVTLIRDHARFNGACAVEVGGETLTAERIFINVGARARVPDFPGLAQVDYLTNSSMLELDVLPEHLLIVGASILGLSGDEAVHTLLDSMYAKQPYTVISRATHIHPTVTELIPTLLQGLVPLGEPGLPAFRGGTACISPSLNHAWSKASASD